MQLESFYAQIDAPYREVLERFCNDEGMLEMFVGSFPKDKTYAGLTAAVETGDAQQIRYQAHALKGVAANLGFVGLQAACAALDQCIRQERMGEIAPCYARVQQEYEKIMRALQTRPA
jgi:HPt (histidine-containing phosphotransfer) domain-containing protein